MTTKSTKAPIRPQTLSAPLTLTIPATVSRDRFSLRSRSRRQSIATAKGDGFEVEVAEGVGGTVTVQIVRNGVEGWLTFELSASALVQGALTHETEARAALDREAAAVADDGDGQD